VQKRVRITFEWDEANETRLLDLHGVTAAEAEQCFFNPKDERSHRDGYLLMGRTDAGRHLLLVFIKKPANVMRIYSGRDLDDDEKRIYRRRVSQ
jgi:uncharacterized DUF497 family protein